MFSKFKKPLSLLLTFLLLAGPLETVYAATFADDMSAHNVCMLSMKANMTDENSMNASMEHNDKQHQKECNEGRCTHTVCATPAVSIISNSVQSLPHLVADGKISTDYSLTIESFPTSLFRPPRA